MAKDIKKQVGDRVRELREEKGWSQEKLAEKANLHRTYIGQVERGEKNIGIENLVRIAKAVGVPLSAVIAELALCVRDGPVPEVDTDLNGLVQEYRILLANQSCPGLRTLEQLLVGGSDWTPRAAQHLVQLARDYGTFMLRNATAISIALGIEDGNLGF